MERTVVSETLRSDAVRSVVADGRDNKVLAHIERVLANLQEEDITSNAQELVIRNAKELILIRAYRQRKLEQRQTAMQGRLTEVDNKK